MNANDCTSTLQLLIVRELKALAAEISMYPDDESVWRTLPGVTNSAGNIAAHLCGNLQHYVGHVLGGTDYVRNRDFEFSRREGTRAELAHEIANTIAVVNAVMPTITEEMLARTYPEQLMGLSVNTNVFLHHLGAHLAYHLGQLGYLRRIAMADNRSAGAISVKAIAI